MAASGHSNAFGSCCQDLKDCLAAPGQKSIWSGEEQVLYLTIATIQTEKGPAYMDQAILFCPFCGKQLQTKEEIKLKAEALERPQ